MSWGAAVASGINATKEAVGYGFSDYTREKNEDWNEYMSSSAHQREVADLRKAGLNPILSATKGASASSMNSSTPSAPQGNPVQAYLAVKQAKENIKATQANTALTVNKALSMAPAVELAKKSTKIMKEPWYQGAMDIVGGFKSSANAKESAEKLKNARKFYNGPRNPTSDFKPDGYIDVGRPNR